MCEWVGWVKYDYMEVYKGVFTFGMRFKNMCNRKEWGFEGVHGLDEKSSKEKFCEELGVGMERWDIPWVLGGILIPLYFRRRELGVRRYLGTWRSFWSS